MGNNLYTKFSSGGLNIINNMRGMRGDGLYLYSVYLRLPLSAQFLIGKSA